MNDERALLNTWNSIFESVKHEPLRQLKCDPAGAGATRQTNAHKNRETTITRRTKREKFMIANAVVMWVMHVKA